MWQIVPEVQRRSNPNESTNKPRECIKHGKRRLVVEEEMENA
jgi:hypothetical protein